MGFSRQEHGSGLPFPSPSKTIERKWSRSVVSDSVTPCTVAYQAPLSMELSRQEYWSGLPFPSPGDLPDPGIKPGAPVLQEDSLENCMLLLFSRSALSYSLLPYGLQHTRLTCPSPSPGACSNACQLSQWYHPNTLFSFISFSSHLQSFPTSGSFPMIWLFASEGQSIGAAASASVLPMNIQDLFPLEWTGLISL